MNVFLRIKQMINDLSPYNRLFKNLSAVFRLYLYILNHFISALNSYERSKFTESLTSGFLNAYMFPVFIVRRKVKYDSRCVFYQFQKFFVNLRGTCSNTSGTGTDQNPAIISFNLPSGIFSYLLKLFPCHHGLSPPS